MTSSVDYFLGFRNFRFAVNDVLSHVVNRYCFYDKVRTPFPVQTRIILGYQKINPFDLSSDKEFLNQDPGKVLRVKQIKLREGSESILKPISTWGSVGVSMDFFASFETGNPSFPIYTGKGLAIFMQKENANGVNDTFLFWWIWVPRGIQPSPSLEDYVTNTILTEIV